VNSRLSTTSSPDARLSRALPAGVFVLLVLAAYASPLIFRRNFVGRDLLVYNLPLEKAVHDAWARGTLPLWNPDASGGRPLLPNPNTGAFYPVRPALSAVPFPLAMRIYPVLHWAAAGIGMVLLLRVLRASPGAALVAASTYSFSGVMVSEIYYSNFQPGVTLLPWSLWALVRPARSRARRVLVLAIVLALMMLAGDVFTIGIAAGAGLLWIAAETPREDRRRLAGDLFAALGLAALLAAPQVAATALMVPETHRGVLGMKLAEVLAFSVPPWRLLELAVPYLFGETWSNHVPSIWAASAYRFLFATLYCGAFALAAVLVLARRRPGPASGARFAPILAGIALLLCVPGSLAPRAMLEWPARFPLRYPEKFCVALAFALAVAAGVALDRFRSASAPRWLLPAAAVLAGAAGLSALWPLPAGRLAAAAVGSGPGTVAEAARQIPGALAEGGIYVTATLLALEGLRRSGAARAAGLAALVLVPVAANRRIARVEPQDAVFAPPPFARAIARRDPEGRYRTLDESSYRPASAVESAARGSDPGASDYSRRVWYLHAQSLWGRGTVFNSDLDVGDLSRVDSLRRYSSVAATLPSAPAFFGSLALAFGIRWKDQDAVAGYRPFGKDGLQVWDENPVAEPDIRLLRSWREEEGAIASLKALPGIGPGDAVLETGRHSSGTARPGEVRVVEKSPNRLRLHLSAPDPTWLFVVRGFWNYRTVLLDGAEVEPVPAQIAFTAIPVPAGEHDVEWRERLPGGSVSWAGPALFLVSAAWMLARERAALRTA
jgi:hypothetical protein